LAFGQLERGAVEEKGIDVETQIGIGALEAFEKRIAADGVERGDGRGDILRSFPRFEVERAGGFVLLREEIALLGDPDLLDRAAQDVHELVAEDPAHQRGDQQSEHDARDHEPQILEVIEEGLLVVRVRLVSESEEFFQQVEHSARLAARRDNGRFRAWDARGDAPRPGDRRGSYARLGAVCSVDLRLDSRLDLARIFKRSLLR
jgi:hypothetical protein